MKHLSVFATLALLSLITLPTHAAAPAPTAATTSATSAAPAVTPLPPHILGKPDAPILMNEYVSLTCSHCAEFYNSILPDIEKNYIDTGKVRIALHEFARDATDLKAFSLARCMPDDEYFAFISILFANQVAWATAANPDTVLIQYAKLGGLAEDKAKSCLTDTKTQEAIAAGVKEAQEKFAIQSTPTFIIDPGGDKVEGGRPATEFAGMFDKLLAAKKK